MGSSGKPFEILVKDLFQDLVAKDYPSVVVRHDVKLQGRSGQHQIDVYWEFEVGGITHRVAVEARDRSRKAEKDHVFAFAGKVEDLTEQTLGVMVTREGFQSGAMAAAKQHKVWLYEVTTAQVSGQGRRLRLRMNPPLADGTFAEVTRCETLEDVYHDIVECVLRDAQ